MGFGLQQIVAPAAEPISLAEAKAHLRVDIPDEDELVIKPLIKAARKHCEDKTGYQLVAATWKLTLDGFSGEGRDDGKRIYLPMPPLHAVSSIQYTDTAGAVQTLAASKYRVDITREPAIVEPAYGEVWPTTRDQVGAVTITYVSGYLATFTANAAADEVTTVRPYANGDKVRVSVSDGGSLPGGLTAGTDYYVVNANAAGTTFQLSLTSGGAAVDITSAGTGTHYLGEVDEGTKAAIKLMLGLWYNFREEAISGTIINRIPAGAEAILAGKWHGHLF